MGGWLHPRPSDGEVAGLGDLFASINRGTSIAGWFVMDNPIEMGMSENGVYPQL